MMNKWPAAGSLFLLFSLLLLSDPSIACKPRFNQVSDYVQNRISNHVIFVGTVTSVRPVKTLKGVSTSDIIFHTTRWLGGKEQKTLTVRGVKGSFSGTDCEGLLDFSAKPKEEWLIFGMLNEGKVDPDISLKARVVDGKIPAEFQKALAEQGIAF